MKILLTGGTGFVGTHLLPELVNHDVALVVREPSLAVQTYTEIVYGNDLDKFKKDIREFNPEIVIHLASYLTSSDDFDSIKEIVESNILFTSYLLESLKETQLNLFINTGTFAEYYYNDGLLNPAYFYSASKIAVRPILKYFKNLIGFKSINIVPYTIYGGKSKNKKIIDLIIDSIDSPTSVDMTNGEQILDFIHIKDVVDFYVHCINNIELLNDNDDYHLGTGVGTSIKELASVIEAFLKKDVNIKWGAKEYRKLDVMRAIAPTFKLEEELSWTSKVVLETGIHQILKGKTND